MGAAGTILTLSEPNPSFSPTNGALLPPATLPTKNSKSKNNTAYHFEAYVLGGVLSTLHMI